MPYDRTIAEVISAHTDTIKDEIKVSIPATVTNVHPDRQTVDVQIAINNPLFDQYGGVRFEGSTSFSDVPIGILRGGGFFIWLPVAVNDSVMLIFSDLSMDTWRSGGGGGQPVNPGWVGKHTADSPVAYPMVAPDSKFLASPNADPSKIIIGKDGSSQQIRISATDIELGAPATDFVALASKVATELGKISTALTTIVVTGVANPGGLAVTGTGTATYSPGPVASTLVKSG